MDTVLSVSPEEFDSVVSDHLALQQTRMVRKLLVVRCGALTLVALIGGFLVHGFSIYARCLAPVLFATPPVWAGLAEWRLDHRLKRRLESPRADR